MAQNSKPIKLFQRDPALIFCFSLIAVLISLLYFQTLDNPIVFDTAQNFSEVFLKIYLETWRLTHFRAIPYATFSWFFYFFGDQWHWFRLVNIALHVLNTCLVFIFLKQIFCHILDSDRKDLVISPVWMALLASLIFGLHPLSVYATAYLIQRTTLMATFFGLLGLIFYFKGVVQHKKWWILLSMVFYVVAVHSKEHAIMLPGMSFLLTLLLDRLSVKDFLKKYGWVFLLYGLIAVYVVFKFKYSHDILGSVYEPHSVNILKSANIKQEVISQESTYFLSIIAQGSLFFRYLFLWLVPYLNWIAIDIKLPFITSWLSWPETFGVICFLLYPILGFWLLFKRGVKALLGFGLLSPWVLFATEFSVARLAEQFVLYRSYLWIIGFYAIIPFLFSIKKKTNNSKCFRPA